MLTIYLYVFMALSSHLIHSSGIRAVLFVHCTMYNPHILYIYAHCVFGFSRTTRKTVIVRLYPFLIQCILCVHLCSQVHTFLRLHFVFLFCDINCRLIWLNLGSVDLTLSTIYLIVVVVVVDVVVVVITDVAAIAELTR